MPTTTRHPAPTIAALVGAWESRPARGPARIFIEDLDPPTRAGLLLHISGGDPASAFEYAYQETITAARGHGPAWLATTQLLAKVLRAT